MNSVPAIAPSLQMLAVGKMQGSHTELRVAPRRPSADVVLAAMAWGRQLFADGAPRYACRNWHEEAGWDEAAAELDAQLDELYAKPRLGVEDSAGLIDYDAELEDQIAGRLDNEYWASGNW